MTTSPFSLDDGDGAGLRLRRELVHKHPEPGAAVGGQRHHRVEAAEIPGALVDVDEEQELLELGLMAQVDDEVLSRLPGPGPVVRVEGEVGEAVHRAEGVAQGLDHCLGAVGAADHAAEVEVHRPG